MCVCVINNIVEEYVCDNDDDDNDKDEDYFDAVI